jgi:hypothetical protein
MENTQQTPLQTSFDPSAVLGMYLASIDAWKNNYDAFVQAPAPQQGQTNRALNPDAAFEDMPAQLQKSGEEIFRHAVELQIELCRFFGKRWEQYLDLPSDLSRCRSSADFAQIQSTFLTKMAADYGLESRRLAQAFQELGSDCMAAAPVSFLPKQQMYH